jgi:hypothetical protein
MIDLIGRFVPSSVDRDDEHIDVSMRPNPATNKITLDLDLERPSPISVTVYDVLGRDVTNGIFHGYSTGVNTVVLHLPMLSDGVYYVRVMADGKLATLPIEIRKR